MKCGVCVGLVVGCLCSTQAAWATACYDLSQGEPKALSGQLLYMMFPGPPNYEDVQRGDTPEPSYVLRLAQPICLDKDDLADPKKKFQEVQLVADTVAVAGALKRSLNQQVTLALKSPMASHTGHHHRPLVAWVTAVTSAAQPMDFTDEYGTAATTIRAFYSALRAGQGAMAAKYVAAEKRGAGAYDPQALTEFYGNLKQPIDLLEIAQLSDVEYQVHYRYVAGKNTCDGRANVTMVQRQGRHYIQTIKALNGC